MKGKAVGFIGTGGDDYCHHPNHLLEYYCDQWGEILAYSYSCTCADGACTSTPTVCSDSDGGHNTQAKGRTEGPDGAIGDDSCTDGNHLKEFYCDSGGSTTSFTYSCPCADGACTSAPTMPCTDTDGGDVPSVRGTMSNNAGWSRSDFCESESILYEYYCSDSVYTSGKQRKCHCVDGACIGG